MKDMYPSVASTDLHASFGNEPMTLGSPSSPQGHPSQYLPGYLLGEPAPVSGSPGHKIWGAGSPPRSQSRNLTSPQNGHSILSSHSKDKGGAPPVKSLFDTISSPASAVASPYSRQVPKSPMSGTLTATPAPPTSGLSKSFNSSALVSDSMYGVNNSRVMQSPAQVDPFYTQGDSLSSEDVLDDTWVTVFGFPPSATAYILQQFSQYGNILKHVASPDGNWMHIHYQSKIQAKKARSKHGKIFGGNIMVGVTPCIDKSVMMEDKENSCLSRLGSSFNSSMVTPASQQVDSSNMNTCTYSSIRPLTATYKAVRSENEVVPAGQAPQKSNSFISKTMEYVFGW